MHSVLPHRNGYNQFSYSIWWDDDNDDEEEEGHAAPEDLLSHSYMSEMELCALQPSSQQPKEAVATVISSLCMRELKLSGVVCQRRNYYTEW